MSARTKAALLSALASTGPAGAKSAQKIKYLYSKTERYKAFEDVVAQRENQARPFVEEALRLLAGAEMRMEALISAMGNSSSYNLKDANEEELERVSKWFGVRFRRGIVQDQPREEITERLILLVNWIIGMRSILRAKKFRILMAEDVQELRWIGGSATTINKEGFTWYPPRNHDAVGSDEKILFAFRGPAITLHGKHNKNERGATVAHEALHAYRGRYSKPHPFRRSPYEFIGDENGDEFFDFDTVAQDENQWSCYLLNKSTIGRRFS